MGCPCQNVSTNNNTLYVPPDEETIVQGYYGQTVEMLYVLQNKLVCFINNGIYPNTTQSEVEIYLGYVNEMLTNNEVYKYNILDFYTHVVQQQCE